MKSRIFLATLILVCVYSCTKQVPSPFSVNPPAPLYVYPDSIAGTYTGMKHTQTWGMNFGNHEDSSIVTVTVAIDPNANNQIIINGQHYSVAPDNTFQVTPSHFHLWDGGSFTFNSFGIPCLHWSYSYAAPSGGDSFSFIGNP